MLRGELNPSKSGKLVRLLQIDIFDADLFY